MEGQVRKIEKKWRVTKNNNNNWFLNLAFLVLVSILSPYLFFSGFAFRIEPISLTKRVFGERKLKFWSTKLWFFFFLFKEAISCCVFYFVIGFLGGYEKHREIEGEMYIAFM